MDDYEFGMQILTKSLDNWRTDAWLVELDKPIQPVMREYVEQESGIMDVKRVAQPKVRHVVVSESDVRFAGQEVMVFPAFASGQYRGLGVGKHQIAGPTYGTHLDALDELAEEYVGLVCDIKGERQNMDVVDRL